MTGRLAILDYDRCQPRRCSTECMKYCPGVRMDEETIVMDEDLGKPIISEELCGGCGICVKRCPFAAINIIGLPGELTEDKIIHSYGKNRFRLYGLITPRDGVVGILGPNGVGKSTILSILSGITTPNLNNLDEEPKYETVIKRFSGTELQTYFEKLSKKEIIPIHKPQYIDALPKVVKGTVGELLKKVDEKRMFNEIIEVLELNNLLDRSFDQLSGGELQRVAIAAASLREGDIYYYDEPSSWLDVRQRFNAAKIIRKIAENKKVVAVEHDLIVLDYLSDNIHIMYGIPSAYGVVTHPRATRTGINTYLDGFLREENIRVRKSPIVFEKRPPINYTNRPELLNYSKVSKTLGNFNLTVEGGTIHKGEVVGILGPNGIGKTTFAKILAGIIKPDNGTVSAKEVKISYKPQYIATDFDGTVRDLLMSVANINTSFYKSEIIKPLSLEKIMDFEVKNLSGGELQRVAIASCLSMDADIYLIDEPSAFLDVEQRLVVSRTIRRMADEKEGAMFVIDHDILFQDYISDRFIVFSGEAGKIGKGSAPLDKRSGANKFLKEMNITFRRDAETGRPRVNKEGSQRDQYQKEIGEYYYTEE
ncbi:ribosome biogenesis/translation initiation ATPase RLI [Methanococcus aeolicus]|uniref:ABC transporter related n=1 Tax=Methanococcus aeolicus (strain ATCC BAA-1280 / DSM 17508 / OCM 812 / Nankai-3) TaxID=419665 RepID=A6UUR3_META3|nr:ribosome biogenesis/translation initiation ATPase RLI [Methanococcus aeolicus]ABR56235.1 ABC transporter related [Methanococcus aeolicus Nankai-3]UXM84245.1 ribosome biogenesis/translation initiation ATPase RLI [Methanococcus aeolicus]